MKKSPNIAVIGGILFIVCAIIASLVFLVNQVTEPITAAADENSKNASFADVFPEAKAFEDLTPEFQNRNPEILEIYRGRNGDDIFGYIYIVSTVGYEEEIETLVARVACNGTVENTKALYNYTGAKSCIVAKTSFNGQKMCDYSCFGFGSCAQACPFNAITMENGLPVVNRKLCTSCGICVATCPQSLMHLVPQKQHVIVNCSNLIKGKAVMAACKVGCIKCKKCEKACEFDAIHVTDVARIDYSKCTNCQACVEASSIK